jgi:hypothetical protein
MTLGDASGASTHGHQQQQQQPNVKQQPPSRAAREEQNGSSSRPASLVLDKRGGGGKQPYDGKDLEVRLLCLSVCLSCLSVCLSGVPVCVYVYMCDGPREEKMRPLHSLPLPTPTSSFSLHTHHHQGAKSHDAHLLHVSASGSGAAYTPTGGGGGDAGHLLFASNQSQATAASSTVTGLSTAAGTRPLIMDYQQTVEAESLLSAAAHRKSRRLVYMCGFCASLTSILLGYDVGIMSVARRYVDGQLRLNSVQSEVVMGSLNLIAAFGGLIAGKAADRFGRNRAIALACLIFLTGSACMTLAWNFHVLLIGRVITVRAFVEWGGLVGGLCVALGGFPPPTGVYMPSSCHIPPPHTHISPPPTTPKQPLTQNNRAWASAAASSSRPCTSPRSRRPKFAGAWCRSRTCASTSASCWAPSWASCASRPSPRTTSSGALRFGFVVGLYVCLFLGGGGLACC